ncbi:hypothetical protein DV702_16020 [Sporosarcina sp. PTS2304]|uniref:hypothetical protein n=1 Tax=Sporosarcina sp. PTS2304 TaxID=2283194 RepID=UPI000E0DBA0F|nr:hypothetical protein [Sporosarcina sp. PTS2304]AXI01091.1 hypothetical protein DV702_16020 [Sporosarcina sp. PTS2304]
MLVNRRNKIKSKIVTLSLAVALMATANSAAAAVKSASLDGSGTYKNTVSQTATNTISGKISATNTGGNTTTRGYAKKSISWLPDSTVASTNWLTPGQGQSVNFTQKKGDIFYGQIVGQTVGSRGSVTITVN